MPVSWPISSPLALRAIVGAVSVAALCVVVAAVAVVVAALSPGDKGDCKEVNIENGKFPSLPKGADVDESKVCDKGYEYNGPSMQCLWIGVSCYPAITRHNYHQHHSKLQDCGRIYAFGEKGVGLGLSMWPEVSKHGGEFFGPISPVSTAELALKSTRSTLYKSPQKALSKSCKKDWFTATGSSTTAAGANTTAAKSESKFLVQRTGQRFDVSAPPAYAYGLVAVVALTILAGFVAVALRAGRNRRAAQLLLYDDETFRGEGDEGAPLAHLAE